MKELIIDLSSEYQNQLDMMTKAIDYLYAVADQCEEEDGVIDANGLRHIALNIMKGMYL